MVQLVFEALVGEHQHLVLVRREGEGSCLLSEVSSQCSLSEVSSGRTRNVLLHRR